MKRVLNASMHLQKASAQASLCDPLVSYSACRRISVPHGSISCRTKWIVLIDNYMYQYHSAYLK